MQRKIFNHCAILMFLLSPATAHGDGEAKKSSEESRDAAKKGNEQQLNPNMLAHLMKAMQHEKDAEEARKQQNEGKAQQDQRMADLEKMQAQMLQNQMKQNEDSAEKNKDRGKKAIEYSEAQAVQLIPKTFSAPGAKDSGASAGAGSASASSASSAGDGISKSLMQQIARLSLPSSPSVSAAARAASPEVATMDDYKKVVPGKSTISYDSSR